MDSTSLDDSLFLAKRSIINFFKDLLEEKRGFKYVLSVRFTLKKVVMQLTLIILIQLFLILIQQQ